jgi:DNA-binding NarL/FixJ family response regulator
MGVRDVQLLRLVLPAFQIGIEMARSVFAARNQSAPLHQRESRVIEASSAQENGRHVPTLTPREREVIALLAARRSNTEIAELLQVSRATAKRHTENILQKLGLHSRLEVERVISDL